MIIIITTTTTIIIVIIVRVRREVAVPGGAEVEHPEPRRAGEEGRVETL